jgi:hypothetical protein
MKSELAAALLHRPKLLFLDEPTIGLDVSMQLGVREFIRRYNERHGATVLLTSHYMDDVAALCPRVIVIDQGRLRYDGDLPALVRSVRPHKRIAVRSSAPPTAKRPAGRRGAEIDPGRPCCRSRRRIPREAVSHLLAPGRHRRHGRDHRSRRSCATSRSPPCRRGRDTQPASPGDPTTRRTRAGAFARALRAYPTLLRVGFAGAIAYRAEMLVWMLTTTMPLVSLALWSAVAASAPVGRFGAGDFTAYFLATLIVRQLTGSWLVWEMNMDIGAGALQRLLRRSTADRLQLENLGRSAARALASRWPASRFAAGGERLRRARDVDLAASRSAPG